MKISLFLEKPSQDTGCSHFTLHPSPYTFTLHLLFLLFLICLFGPASGYPETEIPVSEREDSARIIADISESLESGNAGGAIIRLREFLSANPDDPLFDKAQLLLGRAYFKNRELDQARLIFQQIIDEPHDREIIAEARFNLALVFMDQGRLEPALAIIELELFKTSEPVKRLEMTLIVGEILLKKKEQIRAIERIIKERDGLQEEERGLFDTRIVSFIDKGYNEAGLKEIRRLFPNRFPGDFAAIRLIERYNTRDEYYKVENEVRRFVSNFPRHDYAAKAKDLVGINKKKVRSHRFIVGVVLQLEGRLSWFSQRILNGINLALEDEEKVKEPDLPGLAIKDLEEDSGRLSQELDEMINEYRPIAVIGPLLSKDLENSAQKADMSRIPMITPSATSSLLPKKGKYLFRNAMTNRVQGAVMAEYAITNLGLRRFAIIHPDDSYGKELMRVFYETVIRLGGEIIDVEAYPPDTNDFGLQIKRLKDEDLKKYGRLGEPIEPKGKGKPQREYFPGFEALFLPGDYNKVGLLAPQLAFHDIRGLVLLGTNGWNSEELIRIGGNFIEGGIFTDGFFMDSPDLAVRRFTERYRARYGENPDIFSAQAYDAMMMIAVGIRAGATTGSALRDYLLRNKDFHGASGQTTFRPDGDAEKKPFIIQIRDGRFVQINSDREQ